MDKLVGFRKLDFLDEKGSPVKGTQLFTTYPEDGVTGKMCSKLFIREEMQLPPLVIGAMLDITFNRKGKVEAVKAAPASATKSQ